MEKTLIFTICAKNYYGLTKILKNSINSHCRDLDFKVFVADPIDETELNEFDTDIINARSALESYLPYNQWNSMAFKYNLTEFCTSIKPFCFDFAINQLQYKKVIYLDPDIFVFSDLNPLIVDLDKFNIILTPHIVFPSSEEGERSDKGILSTGVFNLGFLALAKSEATQRMLNWWGSKLLDQCYIDSYDSYFTDQRWMDFLPCFFSPTELLIYRGLGANLAPWNFYEREVYQIDNCFCVAPRSGSKGNGIAAVVQNEPNPKSYDSLLFVHFSGFDYKKLCEGSIVQNNISNLRYYDDINLLTHVYVKSIVQEREYFLKFIKKPYVYNYFENGVEIKSLQRRIYRSLLDEGENINSPFSAKNGSYYQNLCKSKLISSHQNAKINDSVNKNNIPNLGNKLKKINVLMRFVFCLFGIRNYLLLLRFMRPYSRIENQLHLYDKKYYKKL